MPTTDVERRRFDKPQAAEALGFSVPTLERRIAAGEIAADRDGGRTFIHKSEIDRYLAQKKREAREAQQEARRTAAEKSETAETRKRLGIKRMSEITETKPKRARKAVAA